MRAKMQTTRWNIKRISLLCIAVLGLYMIFSASNNKYEVDAIIKYTKPDKVWEFVADFSKMKLLNPTIVDFTITSDSGHIHHWKYSVMYRERLSHWPYWLNVANADFAVKKLDRPAKGPLYTIESNHSTCFLGGLYCLYSRGEFRFTHHKDIHTHCVESVRYQCPPFLGRFCRAEVEFQRKAIMKNLTMQFPPKL
ncbi:uncharacterized protein LOC119075457 [Bradysia coprophila]|uniref:uncharacterized protein LOC119075457 n=1 Tax=Bradysia coprophila TaxID=38358 RepID=UPI00187DD1F3|nr:uncharacterized protein LOC119075457 [Bradysia coprophila]